MLRISNAARMSSAYVKSPSAIRSGYRVLQDLGSDPKTNRRIALAEHDRKQYVLKTLQKPMFAQAVKTGVQLKDCYFVRAPVDTIADEGTVVYEYMTDTLFNMLQSFALSLSQCKQILFDVLRGLDEMHARELVHTDLKPNNVLLDYYIRDEKIVITRVKVADVDNAVILRHGEVIHCTVGNVWWRSPEAQLGVNVSTPTDMFSFGLLCAFVVLRQPILYIPEHLRVLDVAEKFQVLDRSIEYFGYLPASLKENTSEDVRPILDVLEASYTGGQDTFHLFKDWAKGRLPDTAMGVQLNFLDEEFKSLVGKVMTMEPDARATAKQLLVDSWWLGRDTA